jgi:adenosylcobyric acid synthase
MAAKCIFVGGTSSHAGKSWMATAICSWLRQRGVRVAPFKAQNMSNNSYPCRGGGEVGRAQAAQAFACGVEPESAMNPILLKPNSPRGSQVVLHGKVWKTLSARDYYRHADWLREQVLRAYDDLSSRYEFMVIEGAGSVAELNLRDVDLVNFGLATRIGAPSLLVGDIERGGIFASIIGTVSLLQPEERKLLRSFAVNKFRGDLSLFEEGRALLEKHTGLPCLGVFPYSEAIRVADEDSLSVPLPSSTGDSTLPVAIIRFPRISNTTDFRHLGNAAWIDQPVDRNFDTVVLPGTKNTIEDLAWLRKKHLDDWIHLQHRKGAQIVGICGGYQMLGESIQDPDGMESSIREALGLGFLPMDTELSNEKTVRRVHARSSRGTPFDAYEIHLGKSRWHGKPAAAFATLEDGTQEGIIHGRIVGTYLHGALEDPRILAELFGIHIVPETPEDSYESLAHWFDIHSRSFAELYL